MLKVDATWLEKMEVKYPGICETIRQFEDASLPACPHCRSEDTADVQCGVVGRTIAIAAATTRFALVANGPKPGRYRCNACKVYFDA